MVAGWSRLIIEIIIEGEVDYKRKRSLVSNLDLKHLKTILFVFCLGRKLQWSLIFWPFSLSVHLLGSIGRPGDLSLLHLPREPGELGSIGLFWSCASCMNKQNQQQFSLSPQHQQYFEYWRHSELMTGACYSHSNVKVEWLQLTLVLFSLWGSWADQIYMSGLI